MILRARGVVTMDGPPIENGAVAILGDRILDVGSFEDIKARNTGEIVDLGERVLLPGLINAHCHLDYTCLRGKIPSQESFTDWIRAINAEKAKLSRDDYAVSIKEGFAEAKRFGTTTMANLTAFPELVSTIAPPIRTWWFAELIDVSKGTAAIANLTALIRQAQPGAESMGGWGLAPHALYTASTELYLRCGEIAPVLTTHLAESREEMEMFREASGPLYRFLKEIGRDMSDCGGKTPLAEFVESRAIEVNRPYLIAHLNELAESDFELLAKLAKRFSIVHCPRSHAYFGHSPFQFERLREFNICLGTDSLASNDDLSLFAEMQLFRKNHPKTSAKQILAMTTVNSARALGKEAELGCVRAGCFADFAAIPFRGRDIFEEIVGFKGEPWTMIGGEAAKP